FLLLLVVRFNFTLPLLGLGLFISTTADADPIVILGFDLLLVGQVRKIQAALFIDRLALLIQTGTAALPQPIDIEAHPRFPGTREWAAPSAPPTDWLQLVNHPQTEAEVAALRC